MSCWPPEDDYPDYSHAEVFIDRVHLLSVPPTRNQYGAGTPPTKPPYRLQIPMQAKSSLVDGKFSSKVATASSNRQDGCDENYMAPNH